MHIIQKYGILGKKSGDQRDLTNRYYFKTLELCNC